MAGINDDIIRHELKPTMILSTNSIYLALQLNVCVQFWLLTLCSFHDVHARPLA